MAYSRYLNQFINTFILFSFFLMMSQNADDCCRSSFSIIWCHYSSWFSIWKKRKERKRYIYANKYKYFVISLSLSHTHTALKRYINIYFRLVFFNMVPMMRIRLDFNFNWIPRTIKIYLELSILIVNIVRSKYYLGCFNSFYQLLISSKLKYLNRTV